MKAAESEKTRVSPTPSLGRNERTLRPRQDAILQRRANQPTLRYAPAPFVRYLPKEAFVANTDRAWFDFFAARAVNDRVDEVNFWLPKATRPMREMAAGELIFFRLKKPDYMIAGYGFFAHFEVLGLDLAWQTFGEKNGDPTRERFFERIGRYRGIDLLQPTAQRAPIGCTILRDAVFWPSARWFPWRSDRNWHTNIVQGRMERDPTSVSILMAAVRQDQAQPPAELVTESFQLVTADERSWAFRDQSVREGQGTFRLRLLKAYGRCAITGEHTPIVLDGAHIQPYLGPRSNHLQNGVLLTKEFHALFDAGYVTITPDLRVRVSERLRIDWQNGHRYYPYDGKSLVAVPSNESLAPSRDALAWHGEHKFLGA
jgi:putative restriction endonuclease